MTQNLIDDLKKKDKWISRCKTSHYLKELRAVFAARAQNRKKNVLSTIVSLFSVLQFFY